MKMKIYHEKIKVMTAVHHPTFDDVTEEVKRIVEASGVKNGLLTLRARGEYTFNGGYLQIRRPLPYRFPGGLPGEYQNKRRFLCFE